MADTIFHIIIWFSIGLTIANIIHGD